MKDFANRLLDWFDLHGRKDLPWQQDKSPYRVWLSEIMLQQTQVKTVIPYFERFIARFPSIDRLAEASQDEVLHQWTGLGYYARARNLHAAAKTVMTEYNGEMPLSLDELQALPGIGRSTAGAIIGICANRQATILDGNVKRVLARIFAIEGWPGNTATMKSLWQKAESLTPSERVADYTQAIMDLGATLCTRTNPACTECPFRADCEAKLTDEIGRFPGKKPKKTLPVKSTTMLIIESNQQVLLEKRPSSGLWGGLWSFPESDDTDLFIDGMGLEVAESRSLPDFRHTFTHFHLDITPLNLLVIDRGRISEDDRFCWFDITNPPELGLTKPVTRVLKTYYADR